ncbi:vWA domain-containing protein, partial [Timonella senegalensis]|uniref:vWA domain-containing protein n=1 Tax=Timonella senegalensis TaxID=1465825 RepID=UPI002FDC8800
MAADPDRYFMRNRIDTNTEDWYAANVGRTTGVWSSSRNNPSVPQTCGLKIALVVDTSGSLGAAGIASMKALMSSFVDSFAGTATSMALFSYSNVSPGNNATNHPTLLPVGTPAQAAVFKNQYATWSAGGGTNWDRGFAEAASASPSYDLVINLTDGNPTVIRDDSGSGSSAYNSIQDVDAGIFSANQLKAKGTSVLAVGIGSALTSNSKANLRAVSGPVEGKDFVLAANFDEAADYLKTLADVSCDAKVSVQKMIIPSDGTFEDATPAPAGWEFNATSHNSAITVKAPATKTTTATSNGTVDFALGLALPSSTGNVSLVETQQEGYELVPVGEGAGAKNGVCTNTTTDTPVEVTNVNSQTHPGVQVPVSAAGDVHCIIYNRQLAPGELVVEKNSTPASGTVLTNGDEVTYELVFTNSGDMPVEVDHEDLLVDVLDDAALVGTPSAQSPLTAVFNSTSQKLAISGTL